MNLATHFGENLARCRGRAKLTQDELAIRASLTRGEIGRLERGERIAGIDTLVRLCGALSAPADELLAGIAWAPGSARAGRFEFTTTAAAEAMERSTAP